MRISAAGNVAVAGAIGLTGATSGSFTLAAAAVAGIGYGFSHSGGNSTQSNAALIATSGDTNTAVVVTPKGTGAIIAGPTPDGTATGGNSRGTSAVDLQISRTAATQVASGSYSFVAGQGNTASNNYAIALGNNVNVSANFASAGIGQNITISGVFGSVLGSNATLSGTQSIGLGSFHSITGSYSAALGQNISDKGRTRTIVFSVGDFGNNQTADGDSQTVFTHLRAATASTSAATLTADGAAAGSTNILNLANNSAMRLTIDVIGRDTTNGNTGGWKIEAVIKRGANAAATALVGTPVGAVIGLDSGWASQTAPTLTADTTNGGLTLSVTPITTNACRWVARVLAVEVA
jgi:hypothetical protein